MNTKKQFNKEKYVALKKEFERIAKLILNYNTRPIPKEENWTTRTIDEFVSAFNKYKAYVQLCFAELENKQAFLDKIDAFGIIFIARLAILNCTTDLPERFEEIDIRNLKSIDETEAANLSVLEENSDDSENNTDSEGELDHKQKTTDIGTSGQDLPELKPQSSTTIKKDQATETPKNLSQPRNAIMGDFEYLANVGRVIRNNYDGDPGALDAFIAAIEMASAASPANLQQTLVKCIRTKLTGKALEAVPAETQNANEVIRLLKDKIKTENTKVVMGRFLALKADRSSMKKFSDEAEELADKLRKAYICDGIPTDLAKKMTIEKTIEMCRLSAKTPLVKSVLASTHFEEPRDVVAKFITESSAEKTEAQILSFGKNTNVRNNQNNRGRGGHRNNNRGYFNRHNGYNNRGNFQGRGRGNFRGNFRGRRNFNNGNYNNGHNNYGNRNIRMITQSENGQAPTQERGNQQTQVVVREME